MLFRNDLKLCKRKISENYVFSEIVFYIKLIAPCRVIFYFWNDFFSRKNNPYEVSVSVLRIYNIQYSRYTVKYIICRRDENYIHCALYRDRCKRVINRFLSLTLKWSQVCSILWCICTTFYQLNVFNSFVKNIAQPY